MSSTPKALQALNVVSALMALMALGMVFLYAPREAIMGEVQRIFYFHVGSAWVSGIAFTVTLVAGVLMLITNKPQWDRLGLASVEVGVVFATMTLISGMLWARPIWNAWWTWDPRLTTFTILLLIYFAYLMLRQAIEDPNRRARFAAVYGIVGFVSVPLTWFSIRWWRTIHPVVIGSGDPSAKGTFDMLPAMVHTLLFSLAMFCVLYVTLTWHRMRLAEYEERLEQLKVKLMHG